MKRLTNCYIALALAAVLFAFSATQAKGRASIFFSSCSLAPDNRTASLGYNDGTIKLWDITTGKLLRIFHGHQKLVGSLVYLPDGKSLMSGGTDGTIRRWDMASGKELWRTNAQGDKTYPLYLEYGNTIESLALSPDGKSVVAGNHDGVVKILDAATGEAIRTFRGYQGAVRHIAYSADGKMILSTAPAKDIGYISLWDAATGGEIKRLPDTSTLIYAAFSPDGKMILSGGNKSLRLWDVATGKLIRTFNDPNYIDSVALSPDGKIALTGAAYMGDGQIKLWDVSTGKIIRRLTGHTDNVVTLDFSPDSLYVLSVSRDHMLIWWNVTTGRILRKFKID